MALWPHFIRRFGALGSTYHISFLSIFLYGISLSFVTVELDL